MTLSRTSAVFVLALALLLPLSVDAASGTTFTSGGVTRTSPFKTGATTFQVTSTFTSADAAYFDFDFSSGGTLDNYGCFLGLPFGAANGMELNPPSPPYAFTNTSSTAYDGRVGVFTASFGCTDRGYAWASYHNRPLPAGWMYSNFPTPTKKAVFYNYPVYAQSVSTFTDSDFSSAFASSDPGTCPSGTVLGQVSYSPHSVISTAGSRVPAEDKAFSTWAVAYCNKFAEANCCLIQPDYSFGSISSGLGSSGIGGDGGNNGGYTPMTIVAVKTTETHRPTLEECMNQASGIMGTDVSPFCQYYWGGFYVALKNPPKPNLTASVAPVQATAGVLKKFSGTITNNGAATTGVGYTNTMQFDDDNSLTDWETYGSVDGTATSTMNAAATAVGASKTVSAYFTIPSATPATWYYRVCADLPPVWSGVISESDENNCGAWTPITVAANPVTASLTPAPASIALGGSSVLTWTGGGAAVSCSSDEFATGGAKTGTVSVSPSATTMYHLTCVSATGGSSSGDWASGEWWTGGTQTVIYQETVADNGQQGDTCSIAAGNAGYSAWNMSIARHPYQCGDAGCDLAAVKCWGVRGATGTVAKPVTQSGNCALQSSTCAETGYFRSATGVPDGGTANATATVTVTPLTASCSASPTSASINQPVTWSVTASGGTTPYTYAWSGTDGLSGSGASVQKSYTSPGPKTASVTVYSPVIASIDTPERFAVLHNAVRAISTFFVSVAHALATGSCSGSFTAGGDTDCPDNVGGGTGTNYNYVTVACDADSNPGDGTVTVSGPAVSCSASPASMSTAPTTVRYTASVANGSGYSYAWTPSAGDTTCPVPATGNPINCTLNTLGNHSMTVTATKSGSPTLTNTCAVSASCTTDSMSITGTPDRVNTNGTSRISWTADSTCGCTVTGPGIASPVVPTGSQNVSVTKQSTYTLTCNGVKKTAIVNLVPKFENF